MISYLGNLYHDRITNMSVEHQSSPFLEEIHPSGLKFAPFT